MRIRLQRVGNSLGVILPEQILARVGFGQYVDVAVEHGAVVLRRPNLHPRKGWAEASRALSVAGDDALVWSEFPHEADSDIIW